jgi:hypothetical protein
MDMCNFRAHLFQPKIKNKESSEAEIQYTIFLNLLPWKMKLQNFVPDVISFQKVF